MPTGSDYLPVATAVGANVDSQVNFDGSSYQLNGFVNGVAQPYEANKIWRQASMVGAAVTNFISNILGIYIFDDGNEANLISELTQAIQQAAGSKNGELVTFASTVTLNATNFNAFELTLTGPCTITLGGGSPWTDILVILHQDGTGGRAVTWANANGGDPDPAASQTTTYRFTQDHAGVWHASSPSMVG